MQLHSVLISVASFTMRIHATPIGPEDVSERAVNSTIGAINAIIFDHTGHDISSSFQIRLYYGEALASDVGNHSLSDRQVAFSRRLNTCPRPAEFRESFCTPENGGAGSLQRYTIVCRQTFAMRGGVETAVERNHALLYAALIGGPPITRQETIRRDGHCDNDEICVDGLGSEESRSGRRMASCIRTEYFIKYVNWGNNEHQSSLDLEGKMVSMVVSQQDGMTSVEVDTLEVDTERAGAVQRKQCRDCVRLKTDPFGAETDNLRFRVKLLTAGGIAGVLWLIIASG